MPPAKRAPSVERSSDVRRFNSIQRTQGQGRSLQQGAFVASRKAWPGSIPRLPAGGWQFETIVVYVAGNVGEELFGGGSDSGCRNDLLAARSLAASIFPEDDVDDVIDRARRCARSILKSNFAALAALAVALIGERTLFLGEIEEIVAANSEVDIEAIPDADNEDERSDDGMVTLSEFMKARASGERLGQRLVYYGIRR
jgi:hypothetical protein